jgi:hypothetical protein
MSTRELGKKLLEELEAMGPDLSHVGKTTVKFLNGHPSAMKNDKGQPQQDTHVKDESIESSETYDDVSGLRKLRELRTSMYQEFLASKDQGTKGGNRIESKGLDK